jgi:hypothetical protein
MKFPAAVSACSPMTRNHNPLTRKVPEFHALIQHFTDNSSSSSFSLCFTQIGKGLFHRLFSGSFSSAEERRNTVVMDSRRFRPRETLDSNP